MTPINRLKVVEDRKSYVPHMLAIALLWSLAMTLDYRDQAAAANARAARMDAEHTACLRGEWRAVTEQGVELGCLPVEINEPPRRREHVMSEKQATGATRPSSQTKTPR